jgi:protein TonB
MRSRGTVQAVVIGTVLVHVALLTGLDIAGQWAVHHHPAPPEVIELDDTPPPPKLPPPAVKPPPPPPPQKAPDPAPQPPPEHHTVARVATRTAPPVHTQEPPPQQDPQAPTTPGGGDEPYRLPDGPTGNVPIAVGHGHGTGATGTGSGGGSGSAAGPAIVPAAAPVSIAAIKQKAMPRGDYSYFGAGADYPPEARQQGIEGTIRVRLIVDATGKVVSKTLLNKLGHGLDELALARAEQIQFDPALDDHDQPVKSVVIWTFDFRLPK